MSTGYRDGDVARPVAPGMQAHSLAYRIRRHDAEVSFKLDIFIEEFFIQFFGHLAWPCIVYRKGRTGARSRTLNCDPNQGQFTISVVMALSIGCYWAFRFSGLGFSVTATEHAVLMLLFAARAAVVAGKYAHYDRVSYSRLDRAPLSEEDRVAKLVLVGWVTPTPRLVFREMEKAIARSSAYLGRLRIVFPSSDERDAVLLTMAASLPSYCELEFGVAPTQQQPAPRSVRDPPNEAPGVRHSPRAFCCCCGRGRQPQQMRRRPSPAAETRADPPVSPEAAVAAFIEAAPPDALLALEPDPAGVDVYADLSEDTAGVVSIPSLPRPATAATPAQPLPALPTKAVLWHILHKRYVLQFSHWAYRVSVGLALVFALLPSILRIAGLHGDASWASEPCTIILLIINAYATLIVVVVVQMFLFVGVLDLARRRRCAEDLEACLDADASIALRTEASFGGVGSGAVAADGSDASDDGPVPPFRGSQTQIWASTAQPADPRAAAWSRPPTYTYTLDGGVMLPARALPGAVTTTVPDAAPTPSARSAAQVRLAASHGTPAAVGIVARGTPAVASPSPAARVARVSGGETHSLHSVRHSHGSKTGGRKSLTRVRSLIAVNPASEDALLLRLLRGGRGSGASEVKGAARPSAELPLAAQHSLMAMPGMCAAPPPPLGDDSQRPAKDPPERRGSNVDDAVFVAVDASPRPPPRWSRSSVIPEAPPPDEVDEVDDDDDDEPGGSGVVGGGRSGGGGGGRASSHLLLGGHQARSDVAQRYGGFSAAEIHALVPVHAGSASSSEGACAGLCGGGAATAALFGPGAGGVQLPLLYPSNLLCWAALRHTLYDVGREYAMRISFCCLLFFCLVLVGELGLLGATLFAEGQSGSGSGGAGAGAASGGTPVDFLMLAVLVGFLLIVFGLGIVAQILEGALVNRATAAHQLRLNTLETLVYELLSTAVAAAALPRSVRLRLLAVHRVASVIGERLKILDELEPARVMFVPARFALLGAMGSVTGSVVLLLLRAFEAAASMRYT